METPRPRRARHVVPWIVSAALLFYVFGWATDWGKLVGAMRTANVPLFLAFATADRLAFFVIWTILQSATLSRFVTHVPMRSVFAIRGASELLRVVSNPLSDAAFFLGLAQLCGGRTEAVVAAALVPTVCHFLISLVQVTLALPLLDGGITGNPDVAIAALIMWSVVAVLALGVRLSAGGRVRLPGSGYLRDWLERFPLKELRVFFWGFVALAVFDIVIQWLASRAFGIEIAWTALAARIPLVYLSFLIPTLGNFGTRELAWAAAFSEFGSRDTLIAYAFAVNAVFLVLNAIIGLLFFSRALQLVAEVRRARREGEPVPEPILHDPTDN